MPGLDGTGPWGQGPMTGGARGYCNPGYSGYGRGYGRGFGRGYGLGGGRGFRRGFGPGFVGQGAYGGWYGQAYGPGYAGSYSVSREDEIIMLKNQADLIKADLDAINNRIEGLQSESPQS